MNKRITECFERLAKQQKAALIPYITAGDPDVATTLALLHDLVAAGADIIELGIPFSDPMADGPVIEAAHQRALRQGVSLSQVLQLVSEFRQTNATTPIVLMGYLNPIEIMGYETFATAAQNAGVDGVLLVDFPPEEAEHIPACFHQHHIDTIFLASPTSSSERLQHLAAVNSGYLYYVSLKGVTGAATLDTAQVARQISQLRQVSALPICVGFGINDAQAAAQVAAIADGVIIGSAIVKLMASHAHEPSQLRAAVTDFVHSVRAAMDM